MSKLCLPILFTYCAVLDHVQLVSLMLFNVVLAISFLTMSDWKVFVIALMNDVLKSKPKFERSVNPLIGFSSTNALPNMRQ